jgi:ribonuclease D
VETEGVEVVTAPEVTNPSGWTRLLLELPASPLGAMNIHRTSTQADLERLVGLVEKASVVALDTEADSLHHYFEKTCLLQVGVAGEIHLVDPLAGLDLMPLIGGLQKVPCLLLHGADYDLRLLLRDFGFRPGPVFDTMLAAQLLGLEKISYAALVERTTGVQIDKKSQKADWSRRPLSVEMEEYAAGDVHYLPAVARLLAAELEVAGRADWHRECCEWTVAQVVNGPVFPETDDDRKWRIKGWHSLKHNRALAILRELWQWRDDEARKADLPPFKVLHNETLIALAAWHHASPEERETKRIPEPRLPKSFGNGRKLRAIQEAIERALALPESSYPGPLSVPKSERPPADEALVAALRHVRDRHAKLVQIDPGILFSSSAIAQVASHRPRTEEELRALNILYDWQLRLLSVDIIHAVLTTPPSGPRQRRRSKVT